MVKNHLKALNAPNTWNIARKATTFTIRPYPGAHSFDLGFSVNHVIKNELKLAKTTRDAQFLINNKECMLNGKLVKDLHDNIGLFDVFSLPKLKKYYRVVFNNKGLLCVVEIPEKESNLIVSKIANKTLVNGGKTQVNTLDGRNILIKDKGYKTSDSLLIEVPSNAIKEHIPFGEKSTILLMGGKHIGSIGTVEKIDSNVIFFKKSSDGQSYQTNKKFVFVIGKDKSLIKAQ